MIERININSERNKYNTPQFKGIEGLGSTLLNGATTALGYCESNPMLNVAVLDLSTAIIPRTVIESQTNPYAGFEAFRRESSGLIINCMIPGFIVAGVAKALEGPIMGGKTGMNKCWANEDTINLVTKYWQDASKELKNASPEKKVEYTISKLLKETKGVDGKNIVDFSKFNFDASVKTIAKSVFEDVSKEEFSGAYKTIINKTHAAENIKIKGHPVDEFFSQGLGDILGNAPKILKQLVNGQDPTAFAKKAVRLVKSKSLLGLGLIIPLAISAQPINRWITQKTSGKKGAPIYKDFESSKNKELTSKEKFDLNKQKMISAASMIGVALLSMMKGFSPKMFSNVIQFKGIFPSMDQARLISTATFVSRMMSSEDKNDLREATVRDIATFSAFYFLGDYVAKGIATFIQKIRPEVVLINDRAPLKEGANVFKKFGHWMKDTALKSSDELANGLPKQMRALCQLGNIAFSLLALGLLIPIWNRRQTDKKHAEELKKASVNVTINK